MSDLPLRTATVDEAAAFRAAMSSVFAFDPHDAELSIFENWLEWDRSMVITDGDAIVATGGAISYRVLVPGGTLLGAGGLTVITVQPTHRRRGLLTQMIDHHLEDCRRRREPLSILWASETTIYGRFGYGLAAETRNLTIEKAHSALRDDVPGTRGRVRLIDLEDARSIVPGLQQAATVGAGIPGAIETRDADWEASLQDLEHRRKGATRLQFAVFEGEDGTPRGYARYRLKGDWEAEGPTGVLSLHELHALDGEAYAALWRFVLSIDLMMKVDASTRPVNDPIYRLIADPRRIVARGLDSLWVRILDVPEALSRRRYQVPGSLVLEVQDSVLPDAGGRFLLEGGPDGASCSPTDAAPDLRLPAEHLAAAYLGAPRLGALGWLGMIEGDAKAVALADAMFQWPVSPATSVHF